MQYREVEQQKLREENVLKALQQANEKGENCSYSEEQILEAQYQSGKEQINHIYNELINPVSNNIIYIIYVLTTLILMPILYLNNTEGVKVAAVIAYILVLVVLIIVQVIERSVKKDTEKNREWITYLNKFSNDTFVFGYILTSLGYIMVILDSGKFWYIYIAMISVFSIAIFFDLAKPLAINLWRHFGNISRNKF